jgi:heme exporter protein D
MREFLAMGGYAAYVWPAYAVAALVLIGLLVQSRSALRRNEALLRQLEAARPQRRRRSRAGATEPEDRAGAGGQAGAAAEGRR